MKHRVLGEIPVIGSWFEVWLPSGGERATVKAGGFTVSNPDHPFVQDHGAGYRAVYDLGEPERSVFSSRAPASPGTRSRSTMMISPKLGVMAAICRCSPTASA